MNGIGGRTVAEAMDRMKPREFEAWKAFYVLYPFDDLHRYHRPAAMVAAAWGGKFADRLEFLSPTPTVDEPAPEQRNGRYSSTDLAMINAFAKMSR